MSTKRKKLAVVAILLCVAAAISAGTLAWFTDTDKVENTLKFVTDFEMDLYETDDQGEIVQDGQGNTIGTTYENLYPGATVHKDPTVVNKSSSEPQYIRVTVTVDKADVWTQIIPQGTDLTGIFSGYDSAVWVRNDDPAYDNTAKTVTYTYYLREALAAGQKATLFTGITIPSQLDNDQVSKLDGCKITVTADAIQVNGLENVTTAAQAFALLSGN